MVPQDTRERSLFSAIRRRCALTIWTFISSVRLLPHVVLAFTHPSAGIIRQDIQRWAAIYYGASVAGDVLHFIRLMTWYPEFRNVFYYRIGWPGLFLRFLCPPLPLLSINVPDAGPGLFIQHGYATIITASRVGANCWINQQVTIGYSDEMKCPVLGNNVRVYAGAKVIGNVHVGDNSVIGANAVVVKDVPPHTTVVGVPARIVRRDGVRVNEPL